MGDDEKNARRKARDEALRTLNVVATELSLTPIPLRAPPADAHTLYKKVFTT